MNNITILGHTEKMLLYKLKNLDLNNFSFDKIYFKGKDEISKLTQEINKMLIKIEKTNKKIVNSGTQFDPELVEICIDVFKESITEVNKNV